MKGINREQFFFNERYFMGVVKKLAMIFLAIYLILTGLLGISGTIPTDGVLFLIKGSGIVSAILLLVSIETFCGYCDSND